MVERKINIFNLDDRNNYPHIGHADLHIHSNFSDGKPSVEEIIEYVVKQTDLNVIAICDHNTIEGALLAQQIVKQKNYKLDIVIGEEISTKEGHIVGLFLSEVIPANLSARQTLQLIKKQNGISVTPHPFFHTRMKSGGEVLMDGVGFITLMKEKNLIDAIEVINGTPTLTDENLRAQLVNDSLLFKSEVGGGDAHILEAVGMGMTLFEGKTAEELKFALEYGQTRAISQRWKILALLRYAFFFLPVGVRVFFYTLIHGKTKKRPQIVNLENIRN